MIFKKNKQLLLISSITIVACGFLVFILSVYFFSNKSDIHTKHLSQSTTKAKQVKSATASPYVTTNGTQLMDEGYPYQFDGYNNYSLGTLWGTNAGCGGQINDVDGFFSSLRPNSVVRMWAFQGSMATNVYSKQIDWTALDRIVASASLHNQKLILTLGGQAGTCDDGHWKDRAWYAGGYTQAYNDNGSGLTPLPYLDYVKLIVDRYKTSKAVAMWELINEPESSDCQAGLTGDACYGHQVCTDETASRDALRSFYDTVGGVVKNIDPNHLIESGVIGEGQCGAVYTDYSYIHQSPYVDVASYHDYNHDDQAMPGDQWNGLQERLTQMKAINKPLIVGEAGMLAFDNTTNCISYSSRVDKFKAKMDAQFAAGIAGYIPWDWTGGTETQCNFDIVSNDPLLSLLYNYPLSMSQIPTPTSVPSPIATPTVLPSPTFTPAPTAIPTASPDIQAPVAPTNLTASAVSSSQINLSWNPSTDNIGVTGYIIYQNNIAVATITSTSFGDTNLIASTTYNYYVKAKDAAGNISLSSNTISATTQAPQPVLGIISGFVTNQQGVAISGAKVQLSNGNLSQTAYTNSLGYYTFTSLKLGTYTMVVTDKKYPKWSATVKVTNIQTLTVNVILNGR